MSEIPTKESESGGRTIKSSSLSKRWDSPSSRNPKNEAKCEKWKMVGFKHKVKRNNNEKEERRAE